MRQKRKIFVPILLAAGFFSGIAYSYVNASLTLTSSSVTSNTTLDLTGAGSSTIDVGTGTLSLQTANNGPIVAGAGLFRIPNMSILNSVIIPTDQIPSESGELSIKTSSSTFNFNDGTAERVLDPVQCTNTFIIQNVTSTPSDEVIWSPRVTSTLVLFRSVNLSAGDTMSFNVIWGPSRNTDSASAHHLFVSQATSNSTSSWDTFPPGAFASSTVAAGDFVRILTNSFSSSSEWTIQLCYRENP